MGRCGIWWEIYPSRVLIILSDDAAESFTALEVTLKVRRDWLIDRLGRLIQGLGFF